MTSQQRFPRLGLAALLLVAGSTACRDKGDTKAKQAPQPASAPSAAYPAYDSADFMPQTPQFPVPLMPDARVVRMSTRKVASDTAQPTPALVRENTLRYLSRTPRGAILDFYKQRYPSARTTTGDPKDERMTVDLEPEPQTQVQITIQPAQDQKTSMVDIKQLGPVGPEPVVTKDGGA